MDKRIEKLLEKYQLAPNQIIYINRDESGKMNAVHLLDGTVVTTYIPAKTLCAELAEVPFLNINKGIYLVETHIVNIENGVYTMTDGAAFRGRVRTPGQHKRNRKELPRILRQSPDNAPQTLRERFSGADEIPVAFCIIELVFDKDGHGIDFIFRYCNKEMALIEGKPVEDMIDRSFYEVFKNADRKWLVTYADVALNGGRRDICGYSREIGKHLQIKCFQPEEGFCGCVLLETEPPCPEAGMK